MLLHLFIINKSGGVIASKTLSSIAPALTDNDFLRLGSTFHGLHAIATQVAPTQSSGIESIDTGSIGLHCFQAKTGSCLPFKSLLQYTMSDTFRPENSCDYDSYK